MLLLKRNCYVTHKATRNKNCAALFVVLSYCNSVSSDSLQCSCEKWTAESSVMRLSCSTQPCPVGATRDTVELQCSTASCGSDTGRRARKNKSKRSQKKYFHYSIKDKDYPQLYERLISYRAVNTLSVIKNQSVSAVGGIVYVYFDSRMETGMWGRI